MQENLDLVIEGGWLIDGLGGPRRRADVGIRGERIAAIGDLSAMPAGRRIGDARFGLCWRFLTPGRPEAEASPRG